MVRVGEQKDKRRENRAPQRHETTNNSRRQNLKSEVDRSVSLHEYEYVHLHGNNQSAHVVERKEKLQSGIYL